jgi:hypothetical protein
VLQSHSSSTLDCKENYVASFDYSSQLAKHVKQFVVALAVEENLLDKSGKVRSVRVV